MRKKLISLAVGAALGTAPLVSAEAAPKVKVYGKVQFELASVDAGSGNDEVEIGDNQRGRFGIKASEKLGNGWTAFAKAEYDIGTQKGGTDNIRNVHFGNSPTIREANVGLKGGWGKFEIGTIKSAYKYSGGVKYDPFVATILEARRNGGMSKGRFGQNAFMDNSMGYKTPKIGGGFTGWVTYSPDEAADGTGTGGVGDGDWTAAARYKAGGIDFGVKGFNNAVSSGDVSSVSLFGQFKKGPHRISGQWENIEDQTGDEADVWFLGYVFKMGNNRLVAQLGSWDADAGYSTGGDAGELPSTGEGDYYTVGAIHFFSKKVRVFGGYRSTDPDGGTETSALAVGMRMDF